MKSMLGQRVDKSTFLYICLHDLLLLLSLTDVIVLLNVVRLVAILDDGGSGNSSELIRDISAEPLYWFADNTGKGVGGVGNGGDSVATGVGGGGKAASVGEGGAKSAKNRVDSALQVLLLPFIAESGGGGVGSGSSSSSSMMPSSSCSK